MHIVSDYVGDPYYDLKHTYMKIFIIKIQHMPNIYQQINPTYESFGAIERDMEQRTTLVLEIDSSKH